MDKKKNVEFQEKQYSRNSDGLKQRRLKDAARWKFNPKESYESDEEGLDDFDDFEEHEDQR